MPSSTEAIFSFSSRFIEAPGDCSPSRRVVSKMMTRSRVGWLLLAMSHALSRRVLPEAWPDDPILPQIPCLNHSVHASAQFDQRSEEHTSELQSLMRNSYAVFCLKKKNKHINQTIIIYLHFD